MILSGILLTPTGVPYSNSLVRITANNTSPDVLMFVTKDFKTDIDGEYEIDVPNGWYKVSVFVNDYHAFTSIGNIEITDDTTETTINALLMVGQTAHSDPLVAQVAADAASALASKNAAAISATNSTNSATASANSAIASQTSAVASQTSATNSANSASSASTFAGVSTTKATEASTSAQDSLDSANAAEASAVYTEGLLSTKADIADLSNNFDHLKGAALIGIDLDGTPATIYSILGDSRVPIELFGAVGDYDPNTQIGTDCTPAFLAAEASGLPIKLKRNKKYMITDTIHAWSSMDILGDDSYSPAIYCKFPSSGKLFFASPFTGPRLKNISLKGFTVARIGTHAEHGILLDNTDGLFLDLKVISDGTALGGAVGVSAFYPYNRPSTNCYGKLICEKGGNFGLQYGNVDHGSMQVFSTDTMREVIGIEPYTLGKYDFTTSSANALTLTAHGLTTGYPLIYSRQNNTAITGFGRANYYFAIVVDANTIKVAETKEDAITGTYKTIGAFTGTHRLYKCGIASNIEVLPSALSVGDVPAAGSATGVAIIAAASGGYHEHVVMRGVDIIERNPTSGSHSFSVYGAQNASIENCSAVGSKANAYMITSAFLNNVADVTGDISPTGGLELLPDVVVKDVTAYQFNGSGIRVNKGKAIVEGCYLHSGVDGASGISISTDSEGSKGARARYNTVNVPLGTSYDFITGVGNRDENSTARRDYSSKRINTASQTISKNLTTTGNVVGTCVSQDGTATNFSGVLFITVKQVDANASETAHYILQVAKGATSLAPQLVTVSAVGLLTGAGGTFPSFTWSIDASSQLKATPIGSTNPNATWNFFTSTLGDLYVS